MQIAPSRHSLNLLMSLGRIEHPRFEFGLLETVAVSRLGFFDLTAKSPPRPAAETRESRMPIGC